MDILTLKIIYLALLTYIFIFAPIYALYMVSDIFKHLRSETTRLHMCHIHLSSDEDSDEDSPSTQKNQ